MASKVYNKNNYSTLASELIDLEAEMKILVDKLVLNIKYDLCTLSVENKLAYIRSRHDRVTRLIAAE